MFSEKEKTLIESVIQEGGEIWENPKLAPIKTKIKETIKPKLEDQCCYCRKNLHNEFNMVIDIEHVLPQKKFPNYIFEPLNLSLACKRCNMQIKKDDISFFLNDNSLENTPFNKENYLFIHPNLDNYFENMIVCTFIINNKKLIKYKSLRPKGVYTYKYFELEKLEINSFNKMQDIKDDVLSDAIDIDIKNEVQKLLKI